VFLYVVRWGGEALFFGFFPPRFIFAADGLL